MTESYRVWIMEIRRRLASLTSLRTTSRLLHHLLCDSSMFVIRPSLLPFDGFFLTIQIVSCVQETAYFFWNFLVEPRAKGRILFDNHRRLANDKTFRPTGKFFLGLVRTEKRGLIKITGMLHRRGGSYRTIKREKEKLRIEF